MNGTNSVTKDTLIDLIDDANCETTTVDGVPPPDPKQHKSKPDHQRFKFRQKVAPKRPRGRSLPTAPLRFIFEEFLNLNNSASEGNPHDKTNSVAASTSSGDDARNDDDDSNISGSIISLEQAASVVLTSLATELKCSVCFDIMRDPAILPCTHGFCNSCITRSLAHKKYCPLCKTEVHARSVMNSKPLKALVEAMEGFGTVLGIDDVTDEQEIADVLGMMPLSKKKTASDKHTCTPGLHHADNNKEDEEEKAQEEEFITRTSRKSSFLSEVNANTRGSSFSRSLRLNGEVSESNPSPTNEKSVVVNSDKRNKDDCTNDLLRGQNNRSSRDAPSCYARKLYKITATSFENAVQTRRLQSQQEKVGGCSSTTTLHREEGGNSMALHVSSLLLPSDTHSLDRVTLYSLPPLLRETIVEKQQEEELRGESRNEVRRDRLVSEADGGAASVHNRLVVKSAGLRDEDNAMMMGSFEYGNGIGGGVYSRLPLKGGWLDAPYVEFLPPNPNHQEAAASASSVAIASAESITPHVHCSLCGLSTDDRAGIRKFLRFILSQDVSCDRAALLTLDARQLRSLFGNLIPINFSVPCMARRNTKYSCREGRQNNSSDVTDMDIPATAYAHELCLLWSSPVKLLKTVESAAAARQSEDSQMLLTPYANTSTCHNKIDDNEGVIAVNSVSALRDGWSRVCAFCGRLGATVLGGRGGIADGGFGSANDEPSAYHAPCALLTGDMVCTI